MFIIIAKLALVMRMALISPPVAIFTPATTGFYRFNVFIEAQAPPTGTGTDVTAQISFPDDFGDPETYEVAANSGQAQGLVQVMRLTAGVPVTLDTVSSNVVATPYNIYIKIEQGRGINAPSSGDF